VRELSTGVGVLARASIGRSVCAHSQLRTSDLADVRTFRSADVRVYPGQRVRCDQRLFPARDHLVSLGLGVERPADLQRLASVATTSRPRLARPTASWPVPHAQSRTRELGGRDFTRSPNAATESAVVDSLRIKLVRIAATTGPRDDSGCEHVVRGCCLLDCGQSVGVVTHHPAPPDHLGTVEAEIVSAADSRGPPH
jgi:hypothetical protein